MPTGNAMVTKVHWQGKEDDFIVFVESEEAVKNWQKDRTIPLAQVVNGFKIFVTHKHGSQGILDTAAKGTLNSEFGTHNEDEVIQQILEKGTVQHTEEKGRSGDTNITKGSAVEHHP